MLALEREIEALRARRLKPPRLFLAAAKIVLRETRHAILAGFAEAFRKSPRIAETVGSEAILIPTSLALAGLTLLALTLPLAILAASANHVPLGQLLLFRVTSADCATCVGHLFPAVTSRDSWALGLPFLAFFGASQLCISMVVLIGATPRLVILGWGLFGGLYLTLWLGVSVLEVMPQQRVFSVLTGLRFGYVLLALYLIEVLPYVCAKTATARIKYEGLFAGLFGIVAAWALAEIYGSASVFLTGGLFLLCSFLANVVAEKGVAFHRGSWSYLLTRTYEEPSAFLKGGESRHVSPMSALSAMRGALRSQTAFVYPLTAVNLAFPFLLVGVYVLLLAGRL